MMKDKMIFEIFLTSKQVSPESWLNLLNSVTVLNGWLKKVEIYVTIELNEVRYFVVTSHKLPTTIGNLNDFLVKKLDEDELPEIFTVKNKNRKRTSLHYYQ